MHDRVSDGETGVAMSRPKAVVGGVALGLSVALPAQADDWAALTVGQPGPGAERAFADAFHASEALGRLGFGDVSVLRDVPADEIDAALADLAGQIRVLIYYAGPVADLDLDARLQSLAAAGTQKVAVLVEDCSGTPGGAGQIAAPVSAPVELYLAASAGPDGTCTGYRVTDTLSGVDPAGLTLTLQEVLSDAWVGSEMPEPVFLEAPVAPASNDGFAVLDAGDPVVTIISDDVVSIAPIATPVETVQTARSPVRDVADVSVIEDGVAIFVAPPLSQQAAIPLAAGLPEPSIIIGLIEQETEASFDVVEDDPSDISSNEITFENLDARRALRDGDPELFETLVAGGAFDPPDALLPTAIQTEMARMGCYRAGIDGVWGPGSRGSVTEYFAQIDGVEAETLEPTIALFRQIIRQDDIECPAPQPVAAAPRPSTSSGGGGGSSRPQQTARPAAPPQQPASPPASSSDDAGGGRTLGNTTFGVFR